MLALLVVDRYKMAWPVRRGRAVERERTCALGDARRLLLGRRPEAATAGPHGGNTHAFLHAYLHASLLDSLIQRRRICRDLYGVIFC